MHRPSGPDLAQLLQDGSWLRGFVRTLVPAQDVDDVVQTTALAALQQPGPVGHPRAWLRGISANLARMTHRKRRRHELAMANVDRATEETPAADLVAGLEVQRELSEALLDLPEPTRTILVLRYQEQLDIAAIAARFGLQEANVRQRLHRGREMVRARLQQRFGSDWRGSAAVLAFAGKPTRFAAPASTFALAKLLAAMLLACVFLGAGWIMLRPDREPVSPGSSSTASLLVAPGTSEEPVISNAPAVRTLVVTNAQDPSPAPTPKVTVRGRLVAAEDGSPLADVPVKPQFRWREGLSNEAKEKPEPVVTDANGKFAVQCPTTAIEVSLWINTDGRCSRYYESSPPLATDLGDIPLVLGYAVKGRLIDENGAPMEGVRLCLPLDLQIPGGGVFNIPSKTAADGSFSWKEWAPAGPLELQCNTRGIELLNATVTIIAQATDNFVLLRGRRLPAIRGVVFGPDGAPAGNVMLEAVDPSGREFFNTLGKGRSDADGSFEVFCEVKDASVDAEVLLHTTASAAHELIDIPPRCKWGTSGLRLEVRPLIPVRLRITEKGTDKPVERFGNFTMLQRGMTQIRTGGTNIRFHENGLLRFEGLAATTRVLVWAEDEDLAPVSVLVEESQRDTNPVEVRLARMQPFLVTLIDVRGNPVQTAFQVVDPCGATMAEPCNEPRTGSTHPPSVAILVSTGASDATGAATLRAPVDQRELVVALKRTGRDVWVPLRLPVAGQPIRLVVPD